MIQQLLKNGGRSSVTEIAKDISQHDPSQIEYYENVTNNMVGKVLRNHDIVAKDGKSYILKQFETFSIDQKNELIEKSYPGISVAGRKSIYLDQSSTIFIMINKWLFWIYIALAIILSIMIILKPFSIYFKISMIAVIIAFPFYIYPLETGLYELLIYIYSVLLSVIYNNGYKIK
jgi:hypothetical protein